jgi:hypothetical protein
VKGSIALASLFAALLSVSVLIAQAQRAPAFQVYEMPIARIETELRAKRLTCRALVEQYLRRIEAYDKKGPALNAIVQINPDSLAEADVLDRRMNRSGAVGPLHCVPTIVKDNFETTGQPAALDRGSEHAARRQQPGVLADNGLSGGERSDGLHAGRCTAGGDHVLRARLG